MIELAAAVAGAGLNHCGKVVAFVAPHRPDDGELIDDAAYVREPVGNRDPDCPYLVKVRQTGNDGPPHRGNVIAEADGIDQFAGPLVVLGVESSMWLMPPHMNRKMTDFAFGLK